MPSRFPLDEPPIDKATTAPLSALQKRGGPLAGENASDERNTLRLPVSQGIVPNGRAPEADVTYFPTSHLPSAQQQAPAYAPTRETVTPLHHNRESQPPAVLPSSDPVLRAPVQRYLHRRSDYRSRLLKPIKIVKMPEESSWQSVARLDTISLVAVQINEEKSQQQDIFISNRIQELAELETVQLPAIALTPGRHVLDDKQQMLTKTASGAAIAGAGDLISSFLRYVTTVVMTHIVSPATFGIFVEANTVVTILGYASKFGLDSLQLRFLSAYRAKGERSAAAGLILFASTLALFSGFICAALFFILSPVLAITVYHKEIYTLPFRESALLIPFTGLQLVASSGLQAMKAIKWKVYVDRLIQPGLTLILLLVFTLLGLQLEALIFATVCGYFASTLAGYVLLGKAKKNLVRNVKPEYRPKTWLRFAIPMFFNSMIRNILNSTDILFLGIFTTNTQIGLYGTADRVSYFVIAPLIALNAIFSPIISELHVKGQHQQLESMFKAVTKWSISLSWPVFLATIVFRDAILGVFGEHYLAASLVLSILAFGNFVDAGVGSVNYLLVMTGRPRVILANTVTTVILNISLVFILVPRFGIVGAAAAAASAVVILNIVGLIEVYVILGIHPYRWDTLKPLTAGIIAAGCAWLLTLFIHIGYGRLAIFGLLGMVSPFLLVYFSVLALLSFSEEDKIVLNTIRAKFTKK